VSLPVCSVPAGSGFALEHVEGLGALAVESLNAVLAAHHAAWMVPDGKPLIPVTAQGPTPHLERVRVAVECLAALSARLPDYPIDDPFAGDGPVEMSGVVATSAHAACFLIARRCNDLVRLACAGFDSSSTSGLLAANQSGVLRDLFAIGFVSERGVDWDNEREVERVTHFMRKIFVSNAPAGLIEGEAFRCAFRLREWYETALACERIAARGRAVMLTAPEPATSPHEQPQQTRKPRVPKSEASVRVREYLAKHGPADPLAVTVKAVSKVTGVSIGGVAKTSAWKVFEKKRQELRDGSRKEQQLSDATLATVPDSVIGNPAELALKNELAELMALKELECEQVEDQRSERRARKPHRP